MDQRNRILGCLLGGALGDAWGGPAEGAPANTFEPPTAAFVSDDTQLTLATCEAILDAGRVSPEACSAKFVEWYRAERLTGLGSSTLKSLRDLAMGAHWAIAGARGEYSAGNGAAMRIAPIAFVLDPNTEANRVVIRDVCRITHQNDEAYAGALAVMLALRAVVDGNWSAENTFLSAAEAGLPDCAVRDRIRELLPLGEAPACVAQRFGASGHVVDSVPLALYAAQRVAVVPLLQVLEETIRAGGDTDTNGSIAGQLAGTVVGVAGVSDEAIRTIDQLAKIRKIAEQFADYAVRR